jgi:hypothetical protein
VNQFDLHIKCISDSLDAAAFYPVLVLFFADRNPKRPVRVPALESPAANRQSLHAHFA